MKEPITDWTSQWTMDTSEVYIDSDNDVNRIQNDPEHDTSDKNPATDKREETDSDWGWC